MSFRTMQRFGFVSALALASVFAAACGDDEDKGGGDGDSNGGDGDVASDAGAKDSGTSLTALQVMCGATVCDGVDLMAPFPDVKACCLEDNTCGVASTYLQGTGKPACVKRDEPGVASTSCSQIWDQVDFTAENGGNADAGPGDNKIDGKFTTPAMGPTILANFNGCCTAAGTCSIDFKEVAVSISGNALPVANVGYGCADPAAAGLSMGSEPAGFGPTISCDPATGMVTEQPAGGDAGI